MKMVSRKEWGARSATCHTSLPLAQLRGIAIHYSAAGADEVINHSKCAERVRGIQRFHMSPAAGGGEGPWCDIAYNYLFCHHGYIFEGRGINNRSAAQGTNEGNDHFIALCFLGFDAKSRDDVTPAGRKAISEFIAWATTKKRGLVVRPHSFFHPTECPGDELRYYIRHQGWLAEAEGAWPFKKAPRAFWRWNEWRLAGKPDPRPTGLPPKGSPVYASYYRWAKKYDAYVKKQEQESE